MKLFNIKRGFTLVEMLIVISIVGILATVSFGQYNQFRKSSVLDLAADSIVASINDARDSAKAGRTDAGGSEGSMCFGLKFEAGKGITSVTTTFNNKKSWAQDKGRWVRGGCNSVDDVVPGTALSVGDSVVVESINLDSGSACSVLFSPPNGEVSSSGVCPAFAGSEAMELPTVKIRIGYGDGNVDLQRDININLNSGKAEIFKAVTLDSNAQ